MVMLFVKVLVRYIDHQRDMGVVLGERDIRREIMRHRGRWVWGNQSYQGGLESGGKDIAKQTNECLLRAL